MRVTAFFRKNIGEIRADPALRFYGSALAFLHVLTFLSWHRRPLENVIAAGRMPICWPFFENCAAYRLLDAGDVRAYLWVYLGLAVLGVLLFLLRRVSWAYGVLALLSLMAALVWLQDFQLRLNQHYMALIISLVFLFMPNKRRLLQYQIVAFYFWAGILKMNTEWLSGQALYAKPLGVPVSMLPEACAYVLVLETCLVFGVFARRAWIYRATLAQLVLFHLTSWTVVGFFYPMLMFAILSLFPLVRRFPSADEAPGPRRLLRGREPASTLAFLSVFSFLQIVPWLFPGDSAVTGEGRLFALHMFDARVICEGEAVLHRAAGRMDRLPLRPPVPLRIRCDPIVYLNLGRAICREGCSRTDPCISIDITLRSRRRTESALRPVMKIENFCQGGFAYDLWRPNRWIIK